MVRCRPEEAIVSLKGDSVGSNPTLTASFHSILIEGYEIKAKVAKMCITVFEISYIDGSFILKTHGLLFIENML